MKTFIVEANIKAHVQATCAEEAEIILHNCISIFPEKEYCSSIDTKILYVEKLNKYKQCERNDSEKEKIIKSLYENIKTLANDYNIDCKVIVKHHIDMNK